jgi:hypothetical protein
VLYCHRSIGDTEKSWPCLVFNQLGQEANPLSQADLEFDHLAGSGNVMTCSPDWYSPNQVQRKVWEKEVPETKPL